MYNSDTPLRAELPSSRQLLRSTVLAAAGALLLLVAVVLPAEYGIDVTGAGRLLGLTEMGVIKQQLAAEAAADAAAPAQTAPGVENGADAAADTPAAIAAPAAPAQAAGARWRDEIPLTLTPGQGAEIKLKMVQGAKAYYAWEVGDGTVNFDTHGDARGQSISYEKGRGVSSDAGVLEAAFTGNHGWYWRNRGQSDVTLTLRARGDYIDIMRMK